MVYNVAAFGTLQPIPPDLPAPRAQARHKRQTPSDHRPAQSVKR